MGQNLHMDMAATGWGKRITQHRFLHLGCTAYPQGLQGYHRRPMRSRDVCARPVSITLSTVLVALESDLDDTK